MNPLDNHRPFLSRVILILLATLRPKLALETGDEAWGSLWPSSTFLGPAIPQLYATNIHDWLVR